MSSKSYQVMAAVLGGLISACSTASGQFAITGVADKATPYVDTVTFTIGAQPGYTYAGTLNRDRVPVGVPITISTPDFYELNAIATNVLTSASSTQLVRFIVRSSERGGTEWGLPPHTPLPSIPSAPAEFTGARLRLIVPAEFPEGYEIPVVAWVVDANERAVRANGTLQASGQRGITIKRGVGSGFLAATNPAGPLTYSPSVTLLATNKTIQIESAPTWQNVAGTLNGNVVWPDGARIRVTSHLFLPAGSSLTVGAGAIVVLNPGINITNNGTVTLNGTIERPVVFMPVSRSQPWGGFFMRTSSGIMQATGAILTGSGADPNGGAGHRSEQCLFLVDGSPRISLTDSAAIYLAGQFGHAYGGGTFQFNRFLLQRATTGGEYTGASFKANDSAFIEFPDDSANFVDGDNDALYFVSGAHAFTNTLFGWTKDDGIDSGGSGYGPLTYQSCWFESTFHEGNSLSGYKNVLSRDTVYHDCGQGIENGYNGPTNRMERCLFLANKIGVRHGDNYPDIGNYDGRETVLDSLALYNHRDVFGFNWHTGTANGWTNATGQMTITGNWLSRPNSYFPNNSEWNPPADADRLLPFMTTPAAAAVGVGLATRTNTFPVSALTQGVPVRLSSFTTHPVVVNYAFASAAPGSVGTGSLTFAPGETVKRIYPSGFDVAAQPTWNLVLTAATGGELTGPTNATFSGTVAVPQVGLAASSATLPLYRLPEGIFVRVNGPTPQPVSVAYAIHGDGALLASGQAAINPPETMQRLVPGIDAGSYDVVKVVLSNPTGASLANLSTLYFVRVPATSPATNTTLIPRGSVWRYRDVASAAPAGWQTPAFVDSTWSSGRAQLGFSNNEERDEATLIADNDQITSYFRQTFEVEDPNTFSALNYWLLRDDGGVVYLNGTEIFRSSNLPAPPTAIAYNTTTGTPNGENTIDTGTTNRDALRAGSNVLAVEIHQQSATSSDVSFDFELVGVGVPPNAPPQNIYLDNSGGSLTIVWGDSSLILEQATELLSANTVWTPVGAPSPYTVDPTGPQRFFRLRR